MTREYGRFYNLNKEKINKVFKELRKLGYFARQNYEDCMSCATAKLEMVISEYPDDKKKKVKGAVYYHQQDAYSFRYENVLAIRYCEVDTKINNKKKILGDAKEIANTICSVLNKYEIPYEWDGDVNKTIVIRK